jgi:hypothetical protein
MRSKIIKSYKHNILTLEKFQQVDAINADKTINPDDKVFFSICAIYGYAPEELNKENPFRVIKMMTKLETVFRFSPVIKNRIGRFRVNYDMSRITFGQYIDLAYFFQFDMVDKSNYILATVTRTIYKTSHPERANYFLSTQVNKVLGAVKKIREGFIQLNKEFGALFDGELEEIDPFKKQFNKRYGWVFSAEMVARTEGISLDETYKLPVKKALSTLVYLKNKNKYLNIK